MVHRPITSCSMHEERKLRRKTYSGIRLALIRCSSRDDIDEDIFGNQKKLEIERDTEVGVRPRCSDDLNREKSLALLGVWI
jgi:hypothetical protein